jgi:hypothetical protein
MIDLLKDSHGDDGALAATWTIDPASSKMADHLS